MDDAFDFCPVESARSEFTEEIVAFKIITETQRSKTLPLVTGIAQMVNDQNITQT